MTIVFLVGILILASGVLGWLFFSLKKEAGQEDKAVPFAPLNDQPMPFMKEMPKPQDVLPVAPVPEKQPEVSQDHFQETIDKLMQENDRLRAEAEKRAAEEDALDHLRAENAAFKLQIEASSVEMRGLLGQVETIRRELGEQLTESKEKIAHLEAENTELRSAAPQAGEREKVLAGLREEHEKQLGILRFEIDTLRHDNETLKAGQSGSSADLELLRKEKESLEDRVRELERAAAAQEDNVRFLEYELTKSRAQAAGFERICEGGKKRLEEMDGDVRSARKDQTDLQEKVVGLERSLSDFRKISAGLLKGNTGESGGLSDGQA